MELRWAVYRCNPVIPLIPGSSVKCKHDQQTTWEKKKQEVLVTCSILCNPDPFHTCAEYFHFVWLR